MVRLLLVLLVGLAGAARAQGLSSEDCAEIMRAYGVMPSVCNATGGTPPNTGMNTGMGSGMTPGMAMGGTAFGGGFGPGMATGMGTGMAPNTGMAANGYMPNTGMAGGGMAMPGGMTTGMAGMNSGMGGMTGGMTTGMPGGMNGGMAGSGMAMNSTMASGLGITRNYTPQPGMPTPAQRESSIFFPAGGSELDRDAITQIERLAQVLNGQLLAGSCLKLVGHSDTTGDASVNMRISAARASAVRQALGSRLMAPQRIEQVQAMGEDSPMPNLAPNSAWQRRVEIWARSCPGV